MSKKSKKHEPGEVVKRVKLFPHFNSLVFEWNDSYGMWLCPTLTGEGGYADWWFNHLLNRSYRFHHDLYDEFGLFSRSFHGYGVYRGEPLVLHKPPTIHENSAVRAYYDWLNDNSPWDTEEQSGARWLKAKSIEDKLVCS